MCRLVFFFVFLSLMSSVVFSQEVHLYSGKDIFHPVHASGGMVASQESEATKAGIQVLKEGGNAIDAAVTVGFVLAVTLPRAGNIGGGGFMLVHHAKTKTTIAIDYREKAPKKAHRDMFLDEKGNVDPQKARYSHLSAGVPGTVAGLALALKKYGTISLKRALKPAIAIARKGMVVTYGLQKNLNRGKARFKASPPSMKVFFKPGGKEYKIGERIVQKDLARSLEQIASVGPDAFYQGKIAQKIIADMKKHGGLISRDDLKSYKPKIRTPITGSYRGYSIYSMPPPSSGGIHLVQMLNILEGFPIGNWGHNSAKTIHVMAEAMRLAYADRSKFLGDTDFVKVPIAGLTSKTYAKKLQQKIKLDRSTPSSEILPGTPWKFESNDTTHYSTIDQYGNAVSNTYTLNFSYGSKIMVEGTGILLNNEMDDFSAKPNVPNAYGLIGGEANAIAPEKRMLSSMTPTIVMKNGEPFLVTGSPGGSRIITTTLQVILNVIDHKMNIAAATTAVRIHHQWLPDELRIEQGLSVDTIKLLRKMGHKVAVKNVMGSAQSIIKKKKVYCGASDPRRPGALTLGTPYLHR